MDWRDGLEGSGYGEEYGVSGDGGGEKYDVFGCFG